MLKQMKRIIAILMLAVTLLCLCSCSSTDRADGGLTIVATIFPQYDFARAIVGEKGSVTLLLTPGASSHSFELTASAMQTINNSNLFIYVGPDMEIWVNDVLGSINKNVTVLNLSGNIEVPESTSDTEHDHHDPHIWTDPVIARQMLATVYSAIVSIDPQNEDYYKENYNNYDSKLIEIDQQFREIAANATSKILYFSGSFAFENFAEEYGFEWVAPFNSCSDVQIESAAAIKNLINTMKNNNAKYVFYQELSNDPLLDTIIENTDATPLLLHSAHNISQEDYNNGVTYLDIMQDNADNLRKALCDE